MTNERTSEQVARREEVARAMQEADWRTALHERSFDSLPDSDKEWWLTMADAALGAIGYTDGFSDKTDLEES